MAEHDNGYKRLFSHPEMVADLLRGFVREDWVRNLDFSTLEKVSPGFITPEMGRRESDVIWRVRWGEERWIYVYLLIEFQSTVDPFMALRVLVYVGLLYQRLIQERQLPDSGKLPPVLPLVLYNGNAPWGAAQEISELIEEIPGGLERYRPLLRYSLLDENRIADSELESLRNVAAALFRLEKGHNPEDIQRVLAALLQWLNEPDLVELKRSFAAWISRVLLPVRLPGIRLPEMEDLQEVRSMLAERVVDWTRQWKQEGLEAGRQEGRQEGLESVRQVLLEDLESRFGPLPEEARRRVEGIESFRELTRLSLRAGTASSLADLGLS